MILLAEGLETYSPASRLIDRLVCTYGPTDAHRFLDAVLNQMPVHELAALAYDFRQFWARPKQRIDTRGAWKTYGYLTGRGTGKTTCLGSFCAEEVFHGRARCLGVAAQNEEKTIAVNIASLIDESPPWFKPEWIASSNTLVWPNGAEAKAFTPEAPDAIRSPNFDLVWVSEIQSWPTNTRADAIGNFEFALRAGYSRFLWDATPKRGHPILKQFLAASKDNPTENVVIRGSMRENIRNLSPGVIDRLLRKYEGTRQGREELEGEMLEESDNATAKQEWIDRARRYLPPRLKRHVISIDPAITSRVGSDRTGIIRAATDQDDQALVIANLTGKYHASVWPKLIVDEYVRFKVDLIIIETNKGGDSHTQIIRAEAQTRNTEVVVIGHDEKPRHKEGVIYVKEISSRGTKQDRAQPLSTAYERGRVSHVIGADLASLEETLTTWEAAWNERSPDDLDALVGAIVELLDLKRESSVDARTGFQGFEKAAKALHGSARTSNVSSVASFLSNVNRPSRI